MFIAKIPALMGWTFTIVYVILWLVALYFVFFTIPKALKTNHWISTTATVFENKLVKAQRTHSRTHKQIIVYSAKVRYEYQVDDQTYKGITQKLAKKGDNGEKIHKALLEQYPVGAALPVYYNPNAPEISTTQQGITILQLVIGGLLLLGIAWLTLLILEAAKH